jgi:large subunit ribosomal protein L35
VPKFKTNRAAAKRFSVTGSGRIKHKRKGLRHGLEKVSKDTKRGLEQTGYIHPSDHKNVKILIPYK